MIDVNGFPAHWPPDVCTRLRKRRLLTMGDIPRVDPGHCRWCNAPLAANGRRRTWCSDACRQEFLIRWNGQSITAAVRKRDHGICTACGIDCVAVERLRHDCNHASKSQYWGQNGYTDSYPQYRMDERKQWGPWAREHGVWEADHVVPVSEGGGCCGLSNYRTLCVVCHARESGALRRRLNEAARRKRGEPKQMEILT